MNLNGKWECSFDGVNIFDITVPGCYDTYTEKKNFCGPVLFSKKFTVKKEKVFYQLCFGAVSYYCDVYLNDILVGSHEGMWDSFSIDVSEALRDGENELKLSVIKPGYKKNDRYPLREVLSGFIPDVLCTFGGIWDDVTLQEADEYFVLHHCGKGSGNGKTEIQITVNVKKAGIFTLLGNIRTLSGDIAVEIEKKTLELERGVQEIVMDCQLDHPEVWELENPNLYTYEIKMQGKFQQESFCKKIGYRDIAVCGSKILLNGKTIYARGVLHWGTYEDKLIPNPDKQTIYAEIKKCKEYGFNMIKHCLYIPRESYYEAADELGILTWVELPLWLPEPTPKLEPRIRREYPRILKQMDGYASTAIISLGCELDNKIGADILEEMYHLIKEKNRVLVRDNSGSGECYDGLSVDFSDFFDYHFYADLQNMEPLLETFTPTWRDYRPWLFGEFCDSPTMRDMAEYRNHRGVKEFWWEKKDETINPVCVLKPEFLQNEHDERMEISGIRGDYEIIKPLSIDHSMVHRKTMLEQVRSVQMISGYNITSIQDVGGVNLGIFDGDMNGKFPIEEFKSFNQDVMLTPAWDLTRKWMNGDRVINRERYNFYGGDTYALHLLVSNYSGKKLCDLELYWELQKKGEIIRRGEVKIPSQVENGKVKELVYINISLPQTECAETFELHVKLKNNSLEVTNQWPVFVYPKSYDSRREFLYYDPMNVFTGIKNVYPACEKLEDGEKITCGKTVIATKLTPEILEYLKSGGNVCYVQRGEGSLPAEQLAFWRDGMIRSYEHPVLHGTKRKTWMDDLRYFSVSTDTAFDSQELEKRGFILKAPMIRRYDCARWTTEEYMAEYQYGKGNMIATTLRFEGGMGKQPMFFESNVLGKYLVENILDYFK